MRHLHDPLTGHEIWKITDDPAIRSIHLYHNVDAFSTDGRFLAYLENEPCRKDDREDATRICVFDLTDGTLRGRRPGRFPVWNPCRAQLVYANAGVVHAWDLDHNEVSPIARRPGIWTGSVEHRGRWALCYFAPEVGLSQIVRVALDGSGEVETLYDGDPSTWTANPRANPVHDACVFRLYDRDGDRQVARRMMFMGTDGSRPHPISNHDEWGHHCWSGDGAWYLIGNRCKRWDAAPEEPWQLWSPLPGGFNHTGPCGRDGRLLVGDNGNAFVSLFNRQTHELTPLCSPMSNSVPYSKNADPHPIGSPDGTKIVFDSMYDLERAPVTRLTRSAAPSDAVLEVESTDGFADRGRLVIGHPGCGPEIVAYGETRPTAFIDCRRGSPPVVSRDTRYNEGLSGDVAIAIPRGLNVIAYDGLHLGPGRRREPDVFVLPVRSPQHPRDVRACRPGADVELQWRAARNHRELARYEIWRCAGATWTSIGAVPADHLHFTDPDAPDDALLYAVAAVEHSGLRSERSAPALVASVIGGSPVGTIVLPVGDAGVDVRRYEDPRLELIETVDARAYNHRAMVLQHGASSMCWCIEMPVAGRGRLSVHARSGADAGLLDLCCRECRFRIIVDGRDFEWIACGSAGAESSQIDLEQGENVITLAGPADRVVVDCLRLELLTTTPP